jgi:hypothetical protein
MTPNEKRKEILNEKLRLVKLARCMWEKLDEVNFGQIAHHDSTKEYFIDICKKFNDTGKCKLSDFDSGMCPIYLYTGKKCHSRDNYKNWIKHHDHDMVHAGGDLRFVLCDKCKIFKNNEIELLLKVEGYLKNKIRLIDEFG